MPKPRKPPAAEAIAVLNEKIEGVSDRVDAMHSDIRELRALSQKLVDHAIRPSILERAAVGLGALFVAHWKLILTMIVVAAGGSAQVLGLLQ